MGAQLLLLPLLFAFICSSFIVLHHLYQKWRIKEIMRRKREAAKISLVNIMHLTSPIVASSTPWNARDGADKDLPPYSQLVSSEGSLTNHNLMSSVVTLRDEQESPPPYEDLYDNERKPQMRTIIYRYHHPSGILEAQVPPTTFTSAEAIKESHQKDALAQNMSQSRDSTSRTCPTDTNNPCVLQIPLQKEELLPDPSLERRNSSAVLYL